MSRSTLLLSSSGVGTKEMEHFVGLLKVKVVRGINLAYRDYRGSDPYVVVRTGTQRLKTGVRKKNVNPEWNEDLTLSITDPSMPIKIEVFDKDRFTKDDSMGDAEFSIQPLVEAAKMNLEGLPSTTMIKTVNASSQNCLASNSHIILKDGHLVQDIILRLQNTESGEVELQLQVRIPSVVP